MATFPFVAFSKKREEALRAIDSVRSAIPKTKVDTQLIMQHLALAANYFELGELKAMKENLDNAYSIAERYFQRLPLPPKDAGPISYWLVESVRAHVGYVNQTGKDPLQEAIYRKTFDYLQKAGRDDNIADLKAIQSDWHARHTGNMDKALLLASEALMHWNRVGHKRNQVNLGISLGRYYGYLNDYPSVLKYNYQAMKLAEEIGDTMKLANVYHMMGNGYSNLKEYQKALDFYMKGLAMRTYLKNKAQMASSYIALGNNYHDMGDNKMSLEFHKRALQISRETGDWTFETMTLNNMAIVFMDQKKFEEALGNLRSAVAIRRSHSDNDGLIWYLNAMGDAYLRWEKPDSSLASFFRALEILKVVNNKEYYIRTYYGISAAHFLKKQYGAAVEYGRKALETASSFGSAEWVIEIHKLLSDIYEKSGDTKNALEQFRLFTSKKDSLYNDENTKKNVRTEMNFEFDKKEQAMLLEQEKKDAVAEVEKKRQRLITLGVTGGLLLVLLFSGLLFNRFRLIRKQKDIIEEQKAMVDEKNKSITDSINYAQRIQKALLASDSLLGKNLGEHFVFFQPKDIVSGDFYWAVEKDSCFYLAVCDSTGHGVPGAFMSLLNISFMNEAISEKGIKVPGEVFNHVRTRLIANISADGGKDGMDGVLVCFDKSTVNYSAAHNAPVLVRDGKLEQLQADKMPVGKGETERGFSTHSLVLRKGDVLYLYTDGYADQFGGAKGKKFKYRQLDELLLSIHQKPAAEQREILSERFNEWRGHLEQVDDVLVIGIRI